MERARHLLKSSLLVIAFLGIGKLTGLLRVRLVGNAFGTGAAFDAFTAANQLPELFFILIAGGSLAAAFIPVYSATLDSDRTSASTRLASSALSIVLLILGCLSLVGAIFSPWLTRVILVPDFSAELQSTTAGIMRIVLIQTTIFGASGVLSSTLNAHQHFALPALAPVALDIGYFVGLALLVPALGIHGLAWGTVLGGVLHVLIQIPAIRRHGIRFRPEIDVHMRELREVARLMLPRVVTLGTIQLADLFIIRLTSALPTGSTSAYFYGFALMQFPETLFGTAIALVLFPTMAEHFNRGDLVSLRRLAANGLSIIWFLTLPAAAGLILLGRPALEIVLQGGLFDQGSTELVYSVLAVFSVRLISEATLEIAARLFYAQHNTRIPMYAYLGWLIVNGVLAFGLVDSLGIVGLAIASTVAFTLLSAALLLLNWQRLGGLEGQQLLRAGGRAVAATGGMTFFIIALLGTVDQPLILLAAGGAGGGIIYLALNMLLGGQEVPMMMRLIRSKGD